MERTKAFANRDVSNLIICDYNTGAPYVNLDYANVTTADMTGEVVYAYGGWGHPRKIAFSGDRGGTMTVETQVRESKLYKLISGAEIDSAAANIQTAERVFASAANTFYLKKEPATGTIVVQAKDGSKITGTASVTPETGADGKTIYKVSGFTCAQNDELIVYYERAIAQGKIETLKVKADTFPAAVIIYADTWDKSTDDSIVEQKMIAYKAVAQPNFSLSNSNTGDPGTLTMTFDLMENDNHDILDLIFKNRA